ncbi:MAG: HAD-IIA family hydrolase [Clostridia bacterium]|nr:HAD-IIA family hydrolase [Clostridia bacterium]MDR3643940.1 HAD-IIA family hydrolase [Clostridia bacterium]
MEHLRSKQGFICDMDGVIYHGNTLLPGALDFINWLYANGKRFLFLTNSSERSPRELRAKLSRMEIEVEETHFYTSALATADFLATQMPGSSVYAIGEAGLLNALYERGITMNDVNPDYVVVGETHNYNYENILRAVRLVNAGARLIGTNTDLTAPAEGGYIVPACRALIAPIELSTGKKAYFVGKPNPLIMRTGRKMLGLDSRDIAIVGDRMDTDIVSGIESGIETVLVLSGVSSRKTVDMFPYRPTYIVDGVGNIPEEK